TSIHHMLLSALGVYVLTTSPPRSTLFPYTTLFRSTIDAVIRCRESVFFCTVQHVHYDARALGEAGLRQPDECGLLRIVGQHRFRDWLFGAKLKVCGGKKRLLERRRSCSIDGRECSTQRCHVDQGEILGLEIVERGRCDLLNRR